MNGQFESWVRTHATFEKSSFSEGGDCVEVARTEVVGLRDSKDPNGPVLMLTRSVWDAFASGMLAGVFGRIR
ncbi:DUF397 domain-containing protein [Actinophytocola oryzae]|uniref:Uncharacterized protein DUF397 n=1 Tax=Actinophytocola oryzae TaxID=502181 RepID=A0A4R7VN57_9PSEU|nr:DUF397 domain-containing protein [Actinophytocola oryzae]TDV50699.1 uncharacterized protein DUF397 [Actinophytocola oryzae]